MSRKCIHLRTKVDGKELPTGGYTVAFEHSDEGVRFAISMCRKTQRFSATLGEKVAKERLLSNCLLQDTSTFINTLNTLNAKLCVGASKPFTQKDIA